VQRRKADGDSAATMKHEVGLIRSTIKEMSRLGYKVNREIVFPTFKTNSRLRYLDEIEEAALLWELNAETVRIGVKSLEDRNPEMQRNLQDNYDLCVALLDTGCRYSEVANLPWSAINIEAGTINVYRSKVSNADHLYMTARLKAVFVRRYADRRADGRYAITAPGNAKSSPRRAFNSLQSIPSMTHAICVVSCATKFKNPCYLYGAFKASIWTVCLPLTSWITFCN
jgi:hypothetical protein